jgi:non-ribosomal peptide synthase protein (TIGR01720 family)
LDIVLIIRNGKLEVEWLFSKNLFKTETISRLADYFMHSLQELISHCQSLKQSGYTPSDFPFTRLTDGDIQEIISEIDNE